MALKLNVAAPCLAFMFILLGATVAVKAGLGWSALHSDDLCTGTAHNFIAAEAISSTVQVAFCSLGVLLSLSICCCDDGEGCVIAYGACTTWIVGLLGGLLNLGLLIWGIVVLAQHGCPGTIYHTMTLVIVILNSVMLVASLCGTQAEVNFGPDHIV